MYLGRELFLEHIDKFQRDSDNALRDLIKEKDIDLNRVPQLQVLDPSCPAIDNCGLVEGGCPIFEPFFVMFAIELVYSKNRGPIKMLDLCVGLGDRAIGAYVSSRILNTDITYTGYGSNKELQDKLSGYNMDLRDETVYNNPLEYERYDLVFVTPLYFDALRIAFLSVKKGGSVFLHTTDTNEPTYPANIERTYRIVVGPYILFGFTKIESSTPKIQPSSILNEILDTQRLLLGQVFYDATYNTESMADTHIVKIYRDTSLYKPCDRVTNLVNYGQIDTSYVQSRLPTPKDMGLDAITVAALIDSLETKSYDYKLLRRAASIINRYIRDNPTPENEALWIPLGTGSNQIMLSDAIIQFIGAKNAEYTMMFGVEHHQ